MNSLHKRTYFVECFYKVRKYPRYQTQNIKKRLGDIFTKLNTYNIFFISHRVSVIFYESGIFNVYFINFPSSTITYRKNV